MVWDLRRALLAKEEFETARLVDFEFRETVRALRLLASQRGVDPAPAIAALVEDGLPQALTAIAGDLTEHSAVYLDARAQSRRQLIAERGDPTPHRLA